MVFLIFFKGAPQHNHRLIDTLAKGLKRRFRIWEMDLFVFLFRVHLDTILNNRLIV